MYSVPAAYKCAERSGERAVVAELEHQGAVWAVAYARHGRELAVGDGARLTVYGIKSDYSAPAGGGKAGEPGGALSVTDSYSVLARFSHKVGVNRRFSNTH